MLKHAEKRVDGRILQPCTRVTTVETAWDLPAPPFADQMSLLITHAASLYVSPFAIKGPQKIVRSDSQPSPFAFPPPFLPPLSALPAVGCDLLLHADATE